MNCPTCGRRPSERNAYAPQVPGPGTAAPYSCPDPIHDLADAAPEMLALLRSLEWRDRVDGWTYCPDCESVQQQNAGHRDGCVLGAFLARFPQ